MRQKEVTMLVIDPGDRPRLEMHLATWETIKGLLDGALIEPAYLTRKPREEWQIVAWVDEDGISKGLPFNRDLGKYHLFGRIVVVRERVTGEGITQYQDLEPNDLYMVVKLAGATELMFERTKEPQ